MILPSIGAYLASKSRKGRETGMEKYSLQQNINPLQIRINIIMKKNVLFLTKERVIITIGKQNYQICDLMILTICDIVVELQRMLMNVDEL